MSDSFDPYHRWLGIPPQEQPPNQYRLLGLPPLVNDAALISQAADRIRQHLTPLLTGPQALLAQQLLSEVQAAAGCLVDPDSKADYDRQLRQAMSLPPGAARPTVEPNAGAPTMTSADDARGDDSGAAPSPRNWMLPPGAEPASRPPEAAETPTPERSFGGQSSNFHPPEGAPAWPPSAASASSPPAADADPFSPPASAGFAPAADGPQPSAYPPNQSPPREHARQESAFDPPSADAPSDQHLPSNNYGPPDGYATPGPYGPPESSGGQDSLDQLEGLAEQNLFGEQDLFAEQDLYAEQPGGEYSGAAPNQYGDYPSPADDGYDQGQEELWVKPVDDAMPAFGEQAYSGPDAPPTGQPAFDASSGEYGEYGNEDYSAEGYDGYGDAGYDQDAGYDHDAAGLADLSAGVAASSDSAASAGGASRRGAGRGQQRESNVPLEIAKIVIGGVVGIGIALVILRFGMNQDPFGLFGTSKPAEITPKEPAWRRPRQRSWHPVAPRPTLALRSGRVCSDPQALQLVRADCLHADGRNAYTGEPKREGRGLPFRRRAVGTAAQLLLDC